MLKLVLDHLKFKKEDMILINTRLKKYKVRYKYIIIFLAIKAILENGSLFWGIKACSCIL